MDALKIALDLLGIVLAAVALMVVLYTIAGVFH